MKFYGYPVNPEELPRHAAIIMDGNGRWAKKRNLDRVRGHDRGYQVLKKIIEYNRKLGIPYISVFAFSTENWQRPENEVRFLMDLAKKLVLEYTETLIKNDIRLMVTGTEENLSGDLIELLKSSVEKTSHCRSYVFNIVFNYGSRKELTDAVRMIARDVQSGKMKPEDIDESAFSRRFYHPDLPDVDLLIRTSGELRISNFLLWQSSYAEFWTTKKLWPDFTPRDFCRAVSNYQNRKRRFGGL